ncbi:hypothetical protein ACUNV4_04180 [Granulosicoccus sp. 3-233]|uniref:hypothetical protein n=1 Tax=Granulosicoccus sp. 3-233 TaxID=3417969 RepID=UPI003D3523F0
MIVRSTLVKATVMALWATSTLGSPTVHADIHLFEAVNDFPVIDAGEVPYYSEAPRRASLAINAAREDFRNRFARATLQYEGESDFYDITLTALAELDGEAEYRVLVNDVLVGTAINPEVDIDYTPIRHTFEDIVVPHGATIAVESLANTNGKIPEGDGTAFARGRWTTLELDNGDAGTGASDEVDLTLDASIDTNEVQVGDVFTVTLEISNREGSAVATSPQLALTRPRAEIALTSENMSACVEDGNDIICELSELAAGDSRTASLDLQALAASPNALLRATITTDQDELDPEDNVVTLSLSISDDSDNNDNSAPDTDSADDTDNETPDSEEPDNQQTPVEPGGNELTDTDIDDGMAGNRSGGGAVSVWIILLLSFMSAGSRGVRLRCSPSFASDCDRCRSND